MSVVAAIVAVLAIQSPDLSVAVSRAAAPSGASFQVGFAEIGNGVWATEFYVRSIDDTTNAWIVRRSLVTMDGHEQIVWTTETECPVAKDVVESLNGLPLGSLSVPETGRGGPRLFVWPTPEGPAADGGGYALWGTGAGYASYKITAPAGPIADWVRAAQSAMEGCWA